MKRSTSLSIGFLLALLSAATVHAQTSTSVVWETDPAAAARIAAKENKLVLLHFSAEWCRPCKSLEKFVFSTPRVQRAMANNCIAVLVDADQQPELVKQYGVSSVPYDIAMTPSGRIVSKRSSPLDASAYADMVEGFDIVIASLKKGDNPALDQSLAEFQDILAADHDVVKTKSLVPNFPTDSPHSPSVDSMELARKSRVVNPFIATQTDTHFASARSDGQHVPTQPNHQSTKPATPVKSAEAKATLVIADPDSDRFSLNQSGGFPIPPQAQATATVRNVPNQFHVENDFKPEIQFADASIRIANHETAEGTMLPVATARIANTHLVEEASAEEATTSAKASSEMEKPQFALHGKCPVTLLTEGRWVDGDPQWGCVHRRRVYLFSSESSLKTFQQDPDAFSPLLAGFDPVVFQREGKLVDGLEQHGVFMGKTPHQRVVLFRDAQTRAEFEANPRDYIETIRAAMNSIGGSSSPILR